MFEQLSNRWYACRYIFKTSGWDGAALPSPRGCMPSQHFIGEDKGLLIFILGRGGAVG